MKSYLGLNTYTYASNGLIIKQFSVCGFSHVVSDLISFFCMLFM